MAKPYLENLIQIVDDLKPQLDLLESVQCKHFFSGAAAYIDGQIFMSLSPVGLALKLPDNDIAVLFEQGASPLQYFPKAPVKKDYAVLPSQIIDKKSELCAWIEKSIEFVQIR